FKWLGSYRNRLLRILGLTIIGLRMSRGIPSSCTRSVGMIFPRICSRTSAPQRIGRSVFQAHRGGFAPRGVGEPFPCIR
ncbi:hypothetical protein A2U01_0052565, partial [Trifolium medium]|nr:hypothetical protein [Trifolium medium]